MSRTDRLSIPFVLIASLALAAAEGADQVTTTNTADQLAPATYQAQVGDAEWVLQYHERGRLTVSRDGKTAVEGSYKISADEVTVLDVKGPMACPPDQTGRYKWKLDGERLTLTVIEDACDGRSGAFTKLTWRLADRR
jgi:hypothetical protein